MPEHYLGIDVGFSESRRNTTGLCLITLEQGSLKWSCRNTGSDRDRRLKDMKELIPAGANICAVGIDGPLAEEFQPVKHYRAADALLARDSFQKRCKPGNTASKTGQQLHQHAIELAKLVIILKRKGHIRVQDSNHPDSIHQSCVVEAFPNAFLGVMLEGNRCEGIKRGEKSDLFWRVAVGTGVLHNLIRHLVPQIHEVQPLDTIRDHDHRAAFVCALAGLCVAKNKYVSVGHPTDGNICLPPFYVWGSESKSDGRCWGKLALRKNLLALTAPDNVSKYPQHREAVVFSNGEVWH